LITDGPIIIAALWFLSPFKSIELFLPILGEAAIGGYTVGGVLVLFVVTIPTA
jgi:hypothetical protein